MRLQLLIKLQDIIYAITKIANDTYMYLDKYIMKLENKKETK